MRQTFYRLFDVTCAAAGLLVLMPVLAALAVLILWNDGPPVLFSQIEGRKKGQVVPDLEISNDAGQAAKAASSQQRATHELPESEPRCGDSSSTNYPSFSMC